MTVTAFIGFAIFSVLVPLLFTLFFVVFVWGSFLYGIGGGHDEEVREKGKALLMYGLIGFVLLAILTSLFSGIMHPVAR